MRCATSALVALGMLIGCSAMAGESGKSPSAGCNVGDDPAWVAVNNMFPPKPDYFYVSGRIEVANPGVRAALFPRASSANERELDLVLVQLPGDWASVVTKADVEFSEELSGDGYEFATIYCQNVKLEQITVQDVH